MNCTNCDEEMYGQGILMYDPTDNIDWESYGAINVIHTLLDGEQRQALALHPTCFSSFFDEVMRQGNGVILQIVAGSVSDLIEGLLMDG